MWSAMAEAVQVDTEKSENAITEQAEAVLFAVKAKGSNMAQVAAPR